MAKRILENFLKRLFPWVLFGSQFGYDYADMKKWDTSTVYIYLSDLTDFLEYLSQVIRYEEDS